MPVEKIGRVVERTVAARAAGDVRFTCSVEVPESFADEEWAKGDSVIIVRLVGCPISKYFLAGPDCDREALRKNVDLVCDDLLRILARAIAGEDPQKILDSATEEDDDPPPLLS